MIARTQLPDLVLEALRASGGLGTPTSVAKFIWEKHRAELESSGDLLYTWQYDIRWAAQKLRNAGVLVKAHGRNVPWQIAHQSSA